MNREETAKVLTLISTHYWQDPKVENKNVALMVETWAKALEDVPLTPYIENALDWWFKNEPWPPQASQLRERARNEMRNARKARENRELMERFDREAQARGPSPYPVIGSGLSDLSPAHRKIKNDLIRRAANREIPWSAIDAEFERRVQQSEGGNAGERGDDTSGDADCARLAAGGYAAAASQGVV